jgi:hypothetical protein
MIRTLSVLPLLLCALNLGAQIELSSTPIRGEVKGLGAGMASNLTVEAYNSATRMRVGQTLVSVTGYFDLAQVRHESVVSGFFDPSVGGKFCRLNRRFPKQRCSVDLPS